MVVAVSRESPPNARPPSISHSGTSETNTLLGHLAPALVLPGPLHAIFAFSGLGVGLSGPAPHPISPAAHSCYQ